MSKRSIKWVCTANPDWQWRSGSAGTPGFPVVDDQMREGEIELPPNADYWYPCIDLVVGETIGNAYLRYFSDNGVDKIQAITVAQGQWTAEGNISETSSQTDTDGGINLRVYFGSA
ncbi:MAG: hypothetical protein ETSY1_18500 [Candidatus Entotheonella factor]|uniref:Uncharacterized protein n=1 Tax=Entotheonella factor TaxID=1429438 RepID=W4LKQ7_ENTF1|nr:MAG: hypothetical protein ETSY1_18500 [Candidatus Entotheonella factor]